MFFENHYQLSYVTPDLPLGAQILREKFGIAGFKQLGDAPVIENTVWTPDGDDVFIAMRAAIAFAGQLMIELLEPVSGATEIFTEMLEPGRSLKLHHLGIRCDDLEAVRAVHEQRGHPARMIGNFSTARFMYVDTRASLGHFLEYVQAPPEYWLR